jgi:glycosyltransferase involved in cell wall biosynthesis
MKILMVIGTLDPTYGGPVSVCLSMAKAFADCGHGCTVVYLGRPEDAAALSHLRSDQAEFICIGEAIGRYRFSTKSFSWLIANHGKFDHIIVHGIWQYQSLVVAIAARFRRISYSVFVHGALDPWFRMEYPAKHVKKLIYWNFLEKFALRRANAVLFTSEEERELAQIDFSFDQIRTQVVKIGICDPCSSEQENAARRNIFLACFPELVGRRTFLFLSRIHKKKGLDLLIQAFAELGELAKEITLVIAGPDEDGSKRELQALADSVLHPSQVCWTGMLEGDVKWGAYLHSELFCLPSHSENFGLVIAESLALSTPVLISNKVNIWRDVDSDSAGVVGDDSVGGTVCSLKHWLAKDEAERGNYRIAARRCFVTRYDIRNTTSKLLESISF